MLSSGLRAILGPEEINKKGQVLQSHKGSGSGPSFAIQNALGSGPYSPILGKPLRLRLPNY